MERRLHRLFLLRHAEASRGKPGGSDFDRPLTDRGRQDAAALGQRMRTLALRPSHVLCSSAVRTRETWEAAMKELGAPFPETSLMAELYRGDASDYRILIATSGVEQALLVVGHNPMIQELTLALTRGNGAATAISAGFPAGGLAVLDFEEPLWRIAPRTGSLAAFLSPHR